LCYWDGGIHGRIADPVVVGPMANVSGVGVPLTVGVATAAVGVKAVGVPLTVAVRDT
jgi:hypothetical protein